MCLVVPAALAQTETPADPYDLSLEELMNVSIMSASKKEEKLFDAPVASYAITREVIRKAGITSIPEALRLCPDVLVRETTNGNYDIHLRGFDNVAQQTPTNMQINAYTLVMIDNRPIINYIQGGAFWEALPISLVDVDRIEVIRGPSAALYGPNAVTGVINIITRKIAEKDWQLSGQAQYASPGKDGAASVSVGKMVSKKLSLRLSGNYEERQRLDDQHFIYSEGGYRSSKEYLDSRGGSSLDPEMSLKRFGVNFYTDFRLSEQAEWKLAAGFNHSESQKVYFMNRTPLSFSKLQGQYLNVAGKIGDFKTRISYSAGIDDLHKMSTVYTAKYDYSQLDVDVNYEIELAKWISFTPSLSFYSNTYSDEAYSNSLAKEGAEWYGGILDAEQHITTQAVSLRAELRPLEKVRIIASGRMDKFNNYNKEKKLSYQFAGTYTPIESLIFRASYAKASSGFFHGYTNMNAQIPLSGSTIIDIRGNELLELTDNTTAEAGFRLKLGDRYQADVAVFSQLLDNVVAYQHEDTRYANGKTFLLQGYLNAPLQARQQGLSVSVNMVPNDRLQIRPYVTLQKTKIISEVNQNSTKTSVATAHESTPEMFGGLFVNLQPMQRLNVNLNSYYLANHKQSQLYDRLGNDKIAGLIDSKFLVNTALSYQLIDKVTISLGAKNLLNQTSREYYGADRTRRTYFAGLSYNF